MSDSRKNSYALVTGGSSGIGLAFARELAAKSFSILLVSNDNAALKTEQRKLEHDFNVNCNILCLDLARDNAANEVLQYCEEQHMEIEILVNNAGVLIAQDFITVPVDQIAAILHLHVITVTLLCRLFSKKMVSKKHGYILNVSSTSAFMPYPLISLYGPSKTYIRQFTKALRNELKSRNIKVSCLLPGAVDTALYSIPEAKRRLALRLGIMHSPDYIAKQGINILIRNKAELVPGLLNRFILLLIKFIPDSMIRFTYKKQRSKLP